MFPRNAFTTPARAVRLGERIEALLVGVYLNGAAFSRDSATRLLLARLLTYDAQQLAWMRGLSDARPPPGCRSRSTSSRRDSSSTRC